MKPRTLVRIAFALAALLLSSCASVPAKRVDTVVRGAVAGDLAARLEEVTVTAGPASFMPGANGRMPGMSPLRCRASETLAADTRLSISRMSGPVARTKNSDCAGMRVSMARLMVLVASVASAALVMVSR